MASGIANTNLSANITTLYPNPAHDALTISSTENISTISISNLLGQTVYTGNYSTQQVQVSVATLPAGVYFVKINGVAVKKFVKE